MKPKSFKKRLLKIDVKNYSNHWQKERSSKMEILEARQRKKTMQVILNPYTSKTCQQV